ncbi:MAG TPA: sugar phosphate isomerase/epimerase [Pyrinomonadaceae bacterium]|jgi:2-keto-myo-inositol isomerase|nr:sugar phosphate isomerase/epimerase [Pyrinomonadaceae bacterium]
MKLSLNGATTMKADLATDIRAAAAAGFDYVEIWAAKLRKFLQENSAMDLKALFAENGIRPLSINSIEHATLREPAAYVQIRAECQELSSIAETIGCPYIVVVPGKLPPGGLSSYEVIEESVGVLRELASIGERHGVALAFEFLGQRDCSVQTLELAAEILAKVNRRNVGLVLDAFHFHTGGSTIKMIDALDPKRLFIFHIDDAEDLPLDQLTDAHRLLPGLGILPLPEILAAFKRIGYDANASVEIFRPEYWERDPFELAREAKAAVERVLEN